MEILAETHPINRKTLLPFWGERLVKNFKYLSIHFSMCGVVTHSGTCRFLCHIVVIFYQPSALRDAAALLLLLFLCV